MIRDLAFALALCLALQTLTDAPRRDFVRAEDGSLVPRSFYDHKANLEACRKEGVGGTDLCKCLNNPEACREEMPELYNELFGNEPLSTDAILELWECGQ